MKHFYTVLFFLFALLYSLPIEAKRRAKDSVSVAVDTVTPLSFDSLASELPVMDSAVWASKYGDATFGLRFDIFGGAMWVNRNSGEYVPYDDFGYDFGFEAGWRFNHFIMLGLMLDLEIKDRMAFSPLVDAKWTFIRKPYSPYIGFHTGPYIPFSGSRKWTFSPSFGISMRGKKKQIIDLCFGARFYNATDDNSRDLFVQAFFEF